MNQGLAIRSAVTLFALGCAVYTAFLVQPGRFPFHWRAVDSHTLLGTVRSVLGNEGYAFPMAIRGALHGALVCGSRTGEYTHDERRLLAEVAQQVGTALHALRARDNEALVDALAGGSVDLSTARQRARALRSGRYGGATGTSSSSRKDAASTSTELPPTKTSNSPASAP